MEILFLISFGNTDCLYSSSCWSKRVMHGILTTLTPIPLSSSLFLASKQRLTSDPLPSSINCIGFCASAIIYPPFSVFSELPARFGNFCLLKANATGVSLDSIATFHAYAVSVESAGLKTWKFGIVLSIDSCSIGWWVGPSSPTPMLSCVSTYISGVFITELNLIAPFI